MLRLSLNDARRSADVGERGESWDHHCEPDVAWTSEDDVWSEFDVLRALEGVYYPLPSTLSFHI
jgi:hypothetical protein